MRIILIQIVTSNRLCSQYKKLVFFYVLDQLLVVVQPVWLLLLAQVSKIIKLNNNQGIVAVP